MNLHYGKKHGINPYVAAFLNSKSIPHLSKIFYAGGDRIKEITESFGCLNAYFEHLEKVEQETIIVVGDGVYPRTAALFALYTKHRVVSIDPLMRTELEHGASMDILETIDEIDRLEIYRDTGENSKGHVECYNNPVTIVLPHSHCQQSVAREIPVNYSKMRIINLPCCIDIPPHEFRRPAKAIFDKNVLSGKNLFYIWNNI